MYKVSLVMSATQGPDDIMASPQTYSGDVEVSQDGLSVESLDHSGEYFMDMSVGSTGAVLGIVLTTTAFLSGTLGGILIIGAVVTTRRLRTASNALLISLTIPDALCVLFMTIVLLDLFIHKRWNFSWEMCLITNIVPPVLFTSSIVHQMFLALQRYLLIVHNKKTLIRPRAIAASIFISWLMPLLSIVVVGIREVTFHREWLVTHNGVHCAFYHASPLHQERTILRSVITVSPLLVILFCYLSIYRHHSRTIKSIRHRKRAQNGAQNNGQMELRPCNPISPLIGPDCCQEVGATISVAEGLRRNFTAISEMSAAEDYWPSVTSNQQSEDSTDNVSGATKDTERGKDRVHGDRGTGKPRYWSGSHRRRELLIVRTLIVLSVINTAGYLPFCLLRNMDPTGIQPIIAYILTAEFFILALGSNAIVYGILHKEFRDAYICLLRRCFFRKTM